MIRILRKGEYELEDVLIRDRSGRDVSKVVEEILFSVKMGGDPTLLNYCETLDGARPERLELTAEEIDEDIKEVSDEVKETLQEAADRIAAYHREQLKEGYTIEANGVTLKQRVLPIEKVGIYIPGGTAAYPSTVLMNAVPAKIAGVKEIVMVSPPTAGGTISPVILAAARIAGVDRVFRIGGAQAVAALAYGTKSVPKVDKIVGPGNAYVAEAKKQLEAKGFKVTTVTVYNDGSYKEGTVKSVYGMTPDAKSTAAVGSEVVLQVYGAEQTTTEPESTTKPETTVQEVQ